MTDRLREAAGIVEEGFVYWTQDPVMDVGGHFRAVECEVAALLRAVADEIPRIPDQTWVSHTAMAAEALADAILGKTDKWIARDEDERRAAYDD